MLGIGKGYVYWRWLWRPPCSYRLKNVSLTHCILVGSSTVIYWTSPYVILGVSDLLCRFRLFIMKNPVSKHCRPRSDATWCGVWSWFVLFACNPFTGFQMEYIYSLVISLFAFWAHSQNKFGQIASTGCVYSNFLIKETLTNSSVPDKTP